MIHTKKWMVVPYESDDEEEPTKNTSDFDIVTNFQNDVMKNDQKNYQKENQLESVIKEEQIAEENEKIRDQKIKKEESNLDDVLASLKQEMGDFKQEVIDTIINKNNELFDMGNTMWSNNSANQRDYNKFAFNTPTDARRLSINNSSSFRQPIQNRRASYTNSPLIQKASNTSPIIKPVNNRVDQLRNDFNKTPKSQLSKVKPFGKNSQKGSQSQDPKSNQTVKASQHYSPPELRSRINKLQDKKQEEKIKQATDKKTKATNERKYVFNENRINSISTGDFNQNSDTENMDME
jgi:hypothetical protein